MKKLFLVAIVVMLTMPTIVKAQTKEEMQTSQKRVENLQVLLAKYPKQTGLADVDAYGQAVYNAAVLAVANSEQLEGLYYRSIGETKDGVTDVNIKRPTVEECLVLATTITAEGVSVKQANDLAKAATEQAKSEKNPMKAAKVAKMTQFTTDVTPLLLEESVAQGKAINEIIETIKSGKNL